MAREFVTKRNDTKPIEVGLEQQQADGTYSAANLTNATVKFLMRDQDGQEVVNAAAEIVDDVNGIVRYNFLAADTAVAGYFNAEFQVTFVSGIVETFPFGGYIPIVIVEDLGD